jgi:hypothetical protein
MEVSNFTPHAKILFCWLSVILLQFVIRLFLFQLNLSVLHTHSCKQYTGTVFAILLKSVYMCGLRGNLIFYCVASLLGINLLSENRFAFWVCSRVVVVRPRPSDRPSNVCRLNVALLLLCSFLNLL